jgi:hypothetical protein
MTDRYKRDRRWRREILSNSKVILDYRRKYKRFIQGNAENNNRFLPPSPYGYGAAGDFPPSLRYGVAGARNDKRALVGRTQPCGGDGRPLSTGLGSVKYE